MKERDVLKYVDDGEREGRLRVEFFFVRALFVFYYILYRFW